MQSVVLYVDDVTVRWESFAPYTWATTENGGLTDKALNAADSKTHIASFVANNDSYVLREQY